MSVNIDNDVVDVISCVALFYEKRESGNSFLRKERQLRKLCFLPLLI